MVLIELELRGATWGRKGSGGNEMKNEMHVLLTLPYAFCASFD